MKPQRAVRAFATNIPYVCNGCLGHRSTTKRAFSSARAAPVAQPPRLPSSAFTTLQSRRLISLSGPDSTHYLQGVITANLTPIISRSSGIYAAFLNAQGRLLNDVFIYPDPSAEGRQGNKWGGKEGWLVEVDAMEADRLVKHIRRYKLRAKFELRLIDVEESVIWSAWDDGDERWTKHGLAGNEPGIVRDGAIVCEDKRAPGMGRRLILPAGKVPEVEADETTEDVYRVRRYLKGVPEGQKELIRESALPQESNIDFMGGIDYRKGCYVGQELTIRTHHTGVVRKRILPLMIYNKDEPEPTSLEYLHKEDFDAESIPNNTSIGRFEKKGRSAGKWLTGVGNVGLGICRLEIMTNVLVQGESVGYKEGDEFQLEWGTDQEASEMVKVKAFVPPWHLTRQQELRR